MTPTWPRNGDCSPTPSSCRPDHFTILAMARWTWIWIWL